MPSRARLLLTGLLGAGRRARWRRTVLRRALAASAAAAAVLLTRHLASPAPLEPTRAVVIVAHDVPAGATLGASDLRAGAVPASSVPPRAVASVGSALGRQLTGPVLEDEVLTLPRLVPRDGVDPTPPGRTLVHLLADDPASLDLVGPGSRVAVYPDGGGAPLTREGLVIAVDPSPTTGDPVEAGGLHESAATSRRGMVLALDPALVDRLFAVERPDGGPVVVAVTMIPP